MDPKHLDSYSHLKRPDRPYMTFLDDLRTPVRFSVPSDEATPAKGTASLSGGIALSFQLDGMKGEFPETALDSLRRLLKTMGTPAGGKYPVRFICDPSF